MECHIQRAFKELEKNYPGIYIQQNYPLTLKVKRKLSLIVLSQTDLRWPSSYRVCVSVCVCVCVCERERERDRERQRWRVRIKKYIIYKTYI